jgi:hypothetical protein
LTGQRKSTFVNMLSLTSDAHRQSAGNRNYIAVCISAERGRFYRKIGRKSLH